MMEALTRTIDAAVQNQDFTTLQAIFSNSGSNSWQSVGQGEQRSLASHFLQVAVADPNFLPTAFDFLETVIITALSHLPVTVDNAADNLVRQKLFDYKISRDDPDYVGAARILAGTRMSDDPQSVYYMDPASRTDVYVKVAECFLAEDEIVESDAAVQKAGALIDSIPNKEQHTALLLRYKSTYARVLDSNRKFVAAASRYHELSQSTSDLIDTEELLQLLGRAATCAILAPNGPQQTRVLSHIYRDERLPQLNQLEEFETHATIVRKMVTCQILRRDELAKFESTLAPHQKAIMGDGLTILERCVVEHNMVAVSSIYSSIYVKDLARILGVSERKAEKIASNMIMEGGLQGTIDQVEGLLEFASSDTPEKIWDQSIANFCSRLNRVTDEIKALY